MTLCQRKKRQNQNKPTPCCPWGWIPSEDLCIYCGCGHAGALAFTHCDSPGLKFFFFVRVPAFLPFPLVLGGILPSWQREDLLCRSAYRHAFLILTLRWESLEPQNSSLPVRLTLSRSFASWSPGTLREGWDQRGRIILRAAVSLLEKLLDLVPSLSPTCVLSPLLPARLSLACVVSPWEMTHQGWGWGKERPKQIEPREEPGFWEPIQDVKLPQEAGPRTGMLGFPETARCPGNWET